MNVAIAGYGVEGKASYQYWHARGDDVTIVDERSELADVPADALTILGSDAFTELESFDLIVRSPSIPPDMLPYRDAVWSATNEFFANCPAPIIGVTGTKGKGTTASLIAAILRAAGKTVHLVGNIGTPSLEVLPDINSEDIVVFELSSFQLWDIQRSPHIAVVLMIEPDHLDVHADFEEYVAAKANIGRYQTAQDVLVYNANNEFSARIAAQSGAQKVTYPFAIDELAKSLQIPGAHNVENASAAIAAVREYVDDDDTLRRGLESFTGLPHRLKLIGEIDGVKYYDDNYSSAPGSTLAAVRAFDEPEILIAGGYDKGVDLSDLARELSQRPNLTRIILIGETGPTLRDLLAQNDYHDITLLEGNPTMQQIVQMAVEVAAPGDVVIMSPACASFDMFKNFADRGDQFVRVVEGL